MPMPKKAEPETRSGHTHDKESYEFDDVFTVMSIPGLDPFDGPKTVGGYKVTDEYAVFKLTDFGIDSDLYGDYAIMPMWSNFTAAAKAKGVKKAIIDISANGGG